MAYRFKCDSCATTLGLHAPPKSQQLKCPKCGKLTSTSTTVPLQTDQGPSTSIEATSEWTDPSATHLGGASTTLVINPTPTQRPGPNDKMKFQADRAREGNDRNQLTPLTLNQDAIFRPVAGIQVAPRHGKSLARVSKKRSYFAPILALVGIVIGVVTVLAIAIGMQFRKPPSELEKHSQVMAAAPPTAQPPQIVLGVVTLLLEPNERSETQVKVDRKRQRLPKSGEISFPLEPGLHEIVIQRRGYEVVSKQINVESGGTMRFRPEWVAMAVPLETAPTETLSSSENVGASPFGSRIPGFESWLQNLDVARRKARDEKKDVLVAFIATGGAGAPDSLQNVLGSTSFQSAADGHLVRAVVDLPSIRAFGGMQNLAQSAFYAEKFGIESDQLPTLVWCDEQGLPFHKLPFGKQKQDVVSEFPRAQESKRERDNLLVATSQGTDLDQLASAEKFLDWLEKSSLVLAFSDKLQGWHELASRLDPENARGQREKFFEWHWINSFRNSNSNDARRLLGEIGDWQGRKFVDPDRGAKLFFAAAVVCLKEESIDEAAKMIGLARGYETNDPDLKKKIVELSKAMERRDVASTGTGFFVSNDGHMITNHHVIEGPGTVSIMLPDGNDSLIAGVIAIDEAKDIALLKVAFPEGTKRPKPLSISDRKPGRGASVAVFGYPLGFSVGEGLKLTTGVISSLPDQSESNYVLDVRVNPGNSGGPLCDTTGAVVGLIRAKSRNSASVDSYGLAIPSEEVIEFLKLHLGDKFQRAPKSAPKKEWDEIDQQVNTGVVMIVKKR